MKNVSTSLPAIAVLILCVLGCGKFAQLGKVNLFEGYGAAQAAAKIKQKVGGEVKVISGEIRKDSMKLTVQSNENPKNMDEYTFEKGSGTGPEPVQAMSFGNLEMTADKYHTTPIDEIDFSAVPTTVKKAAELSQLEKAEVELISMDQQNAELTNPKLKEQKESEVKALDQEIKDRRAECPKNIETMGQCMQEVSAMQRRQLEMRMGGVGKTNWALTWRIFVQGPRGRKGFWADK